MFTPLPCLLRVVNYDLFLPTLPERRKIRRHSTESSEETGLDRGPYIDGPDKPYLLCFSYFVVVVKIKISTMNLTVRESSYCIGLNLLCFKIVYIIFLTPTYWVILHFQVRIPSKIKVSFPNQNYWKTD